MRKYIKNLREKVVSKLTENDKLFMEHVKAHCKELRVTCKLNFVKHVKYSANVRCSGWFDSEGKVLKVAMNHPLFLDILVHEYAHLTQWQDDIPLWRKAGNSLDVLDRWLNGEDVEDIKKHLAICRDLELDNEKRSLQLIKDWGLSIDKDMYVKRANAYVHFYNWLYFTRRWNTPNNSPYKNEIVLKAMSTKFNMKYTEMTDKVYNAFLVAEI